MQSQVLEHHIKHMQQQAAALNAQLVELLGAMQSLEDFKTVKPGTEILVPISSGVYAKAELKDTENLVVNVGAGTSVKKNLGDTKKIVESQVDEMKKIQEQILVELDKLTTQAALIEREMGKIASE